MWSAARLVPPADGNTALCYARRFKHDEVRTLLQSAKATPSPTQLFAPALSNDDDAAPPPAPTTPQAAEGENKGEVQEPAALASEATPTIGPPIGGTAASDDGIIQMLSRRLLSAEAAAPAPAPAAFEA